jgi:hypothetical protein
VFSYFSLKFSLYIVLEAKCVGNWKSETHWWAHYPVKETKLQKFAFKDPAYWIWELLRRLNDPPVDEEKRAAGSLRLSTNRSRLPVLATLSCRPRGSGHLFFQFSHEVLEKTALVSLIFDSCIPYQLNINRSQWRFGLRVWSSTARSSGKMFLPYLSVFIMVDKHDVWDPMLELL